MNGLLGSIDDPRTAGLLGLGLRLMSTPGKFGQALGQSGLGAMGDMRQAQQSQDARKKAGLQEQLVMMQLAQAQQQQAAAQQAAARQQAIEGAYSGALESPAQQALQGGGGPTVANAQAMQGMQPRLNQNKLIEGLMRADPMSAAKMLQPQPDELMTVAPGASVLSKRDPTKPLYTAPKEDAAPSDWKLYQLSGAPQRGLTFDQWDQSRRRAGATNLTVNTAEKGLLQSLSGKVGDDVMAASERARDAQKSMETVGTMRQALASAKAITGTAANQRVALAQLGQTLGIGPADNPETLAKSREMMMGFGQLELDAAAQMKGQGQITESERAILRRAAAGDITLTVPEIETVLNVTDRRAKSLMSRNKRNVETLRKMPNAAPLVEFLESNGDAAGAVKMPTADDIAAEARRRAAARGVK